MGTALPFRILVVDESPAVRLFVDLAVGSDEVSVLGATDGHAALDGLERMHPDLVLAATGMSGMAGQDFAARLSNRNVPVVLVAGSLDRIGEAPVDAAPSTLSKPIQVEQLRDLVSRMVAGRTAGPVSLELRAEPDCEDPIDVDPIEEWLGDADSSLGMVPRRWHSLAAETGELYSFARDVAALRTGCVMPVLHFRT